MGWFIAIVLFILGGCIGGLIVLKRSEKSLDDVVVSYSNLIKSYLRLLKIGNGLIESSKNVIIRLRTKLSEHRSVIEEAYRKLIDLRNSGTEDLDEVIGFLGEALDDHKEESECNSDQ